MIYVYNDKFNIESTQLKKWEKLLSNERVEKMNKYKFQKDRTLCMLTFLLMRFGLEKEFKISNIPKIRASSNGKLFFENEAIYFNMSHCNIAVACAVDKNQIGVDIQDYSNDIMKIKNEFLSEKERQILAKDYNIKELTRIWTMKEAYGKYYGYGLNYSFWEKNFSFIQNNTDWQNYENLKMYSRQFDKFALSVCAEQCMTIYTVSTKELVDFAERKI